MPDLGWSPQRGYDINLVTDNDFVASLSTPAGSPLPAGAVVTLVLGAGQQVSWPATVTTANTVTTIAWNVDKTVVNTTIEALSTGVRVLAQITYTDTAGLDLTWTTGKVNFA